MDHQTLLFKIRILTVAFYAGIACQVIFGKSEQFKLEFLRFCALEGALKQIEIWAKILTTGPHFVW